MLWVLALHKIHNYSRHTWHRTLDNIAALIQLAIIEIISEKGFVRFQELLYYVINDSSFLKTNSLRTNIYFFQSLTSPILRSVCSTKWMPAMTINRELERIICGYYMRMLQMVLGVLWNEKLANWDLCKLHQIKTKP